MTLHYISKDLGLSQNITLIFSYDETVSQVTQDTVAVEVQISNYFYESFVSRIKFNLKNVNNISLVEEFYEPNFFSLFLKFNLLGNLAKTFAFIIPMTGLYKFKWAIFFKCLQKACQTGCPIACPMLCYVKKKVA